jgi:hypothetical protein
MGSTGTVSALQARALKMKQRAKAAKKAKAFAKETKSTASSITPPLPTTMGDDSNSESNVAGEKAAQAEDDRQSQSESEFGVNETSAKDSLLDSAPITSKTLVSATFDSLGLIAPLLDALKQVGYTKPTEIQAGIIPHALEGKDVIGVAETVSSHTRAPNIYQTTHR